jgi:purine-binding chemotaxis protein CheW
VSQVVTFSAGNGLYAVESGLVREIAPLGALTRLPGAPGFVKGILNLRGALVTVIDLGERLDARPSQSPEPSVVVLEIGGRMLGLLVDEVREVLELASTVPTHQGSRDRDTVVAGLGHFGDAVVIVIDAQELVRQTLA